MNRSAIFLIAVLLVNLLSLSFADKSIIDFHVSPTVVSLNVKTTTPPTILTFSPLRKVSEVLKSRVFTNVFGKQCKFVGDNKPVTSLDIFTALVDHMTTDVICPGDKVYSLQPVVDWRNRLTESDLERIREYVEARETKRELALKAGKTDELPEYPYDLIDLEHITAKSLAYWATRWAEHHYGPLHEFQNYGPNNTIIYGTNATVYDYIVSPDFRTTTSDVGIYHLNTGELLNVEASQKLATSNKINKDTVLYTMTGDWGSGTAEAQIVADTMAYELQPQFTMHLGDIYFVAAPEELKSNVLGIKPEHSQKGVAWRHGTLGSFAVEGNHEMYARGFGYFDMFLPTLGAKAANKPQTASYYVNENEHWRLVSIDTGYSTYQLIGDNPNIVQPDSLMRWLKDIVRIDNPNDKRGIIILSHHQPLSAFEHNGYQMIHKQLEEVIGKRTVLWLFGHEHKLAWYQKTALNNQEMSFYGRCIGIGGFGTDPIEIPPHAREAGLEMFDDRYYQIFEGDLNVTSPAGFNGYAALKFNANQVEIEYRTLQFKEGIEHRKHVGEDRHKDLDTKKTKVVVKETFTVDKHGDVDRTSLEVLDSGITILNHDKYDKNEKIVSDLFRKNDITLEKVLEKRDKPTRPNLSRHKILNNKQLFSSVDLQQLMDTMALKPNNNL